MSKEKDNTPSSASQLSPRERFKSYLGEGGFRVTKQRMAIFEAAYEADQHFTAEELLENAREIDSSVSRATVYRSLPILTESELIREVDVGKDYKYYMANRDSRTFQAQVICVQCDKIFEIDAPFMEWYGKTVAEKLGLDVVSQRLQVTAQCKTRNAGKICNSIKDPRDLIGTGGTSPA